MTKIADLSVKNFKSYKDLNVKFGDVNLVIGANASGKSNLVNVLKFLHDISIAGLDDAISLQGGLDWIRNVNLNDPQLEIGLHLTPDNFELPISPRGKKSKVFLEFGNIYYHFKIKFKGRSKSFDIVEESLEHPVKILVYESKSKTPTVTGDAKIILNREKGILVPKLEIEKDILTEDESQYLIPRYVLPREPPSSAIYESAQDLLMLRGSFMSSVSSYFLYLFFRDMQFFDIDPRLAKNGYSITGKKDLEPDGSNLALVLSKMLEKKKTKETLQTIIRDMLPFVEGYSVKQLDDRSLITYLRESYCGNTLIPAQFTSDGTINVTALLVALLSRQYGSPAIIIEEPDRNIHPSLISKTVAVLKDISKTHKRQLIMTTHSPQFVKNANLDELILVSREGCFSKVVRPVESIEVKAFLKEKMGIEELYLQNLLEW